MDDRRAQFIPMIAPPGAMTGDALWFIFQGEQILARTSEARADVPACADPADLGLAVLRRQYLGLLGNRHCVSAEVPPDATPPDGFGWFGLRSLFGLLDDAQFSLMSRARQIMDWDRAHQYCGRCGTLTEPSRTERARVCPACGQIHYPRIAPVVMALVRDGDRLLLARSPRFAPGTYSALAGFVEAGESLEQSLVREVREEVGIEIASPRYFSSQSWPFPHSLMIAFVCEYAGGEIRIDPAEIEDARWFSVDSLPGLPNPMSIARRLINATVEEIHAEHRGQRGDL
ncbi:MAG: NAD(+) diphosphatase [Armatimonadota bacterium]|nr:NAD(+) diphosphatase [Armatimonadota bacterium]